MATSPSEEITETLANQLLKRAVSDDLPPVHDDDGTPVDDVDDVKDILRETMMKCIRDVEERFKTYYTKCLMLKNEGTINTRKIQKAVTYMENYLMQKFREKEPFIIENGEGKQVHRQALRNCYPSLIQDLDLQGTKVLDRLLEDDVMSIADKDSIIRRGTQRSQNEEFFRYIEGRVTSEEYYRSLIPAISEGHSHLADRLLKEEDILYESEADSRCVVCRVYQNVEVKRLATPLFEMKAIGLSMHADLRSAAITNTQKWEELKKASVPHQDIIRSLKTKYPDFFQEFMKTSKRLECFCHTQSVVSAPFPVTPCELDGEDVNDAEDVAQIGDLMTSYTEVPTEESENEYPMGARPRGICLIINNIDFEDDSQARRENPRLGRREGSNIDVKRLEYIFSKLEFQIKVRVNLSDTELVRTIVDVAREDHSKFDAFICCVLSHCNKDVVYGTNCKAVRISEITSQFRASACPSLAGKPKIFFIQGAQGHTRMQGLKVDDSVAMIHENPKTTTVKDCTRNQTDFKCPATSAHDDIEANIIPDEADFLFGYATPPGFVSYRSRNYGSWYIIKLAEVLDKQADRNDLLSCLLMVNNEISKGNAFMGNGVFKQVPAPMFTLRRKVNLTSDPSWSRCLTINTDEDNTL